MLQLKTYNLKLITYNLKLITSQNSIFQFNIGINPD